jgi:hypothetical protein
MKPMLRLNALPIFMAPVIEAFFIPLKEKRLALSAIPKKTYVGTASKFQLFFCDETRFLAARKR